MPFKGVIKRKKEIIEVSSEGELPRVLSGKF